MMSMGFSEGEARLGLRACSGNVQSAVAHIIKRREVSLVRISVIYSEANYIPYRLNVRFNMSPRHVI